MSADTEPLVIRCGCGVPRCQTELVIERVAPHAGSNLVAEVRDPTDNGMTSLVLQFGDAQRIADHLRGDYR